MSNQTLKFFLLAFIFLSIPVYASSISSTVGSGYSISYSEGSFFEKYISINHSEVNATTYNFTVVVNGIFLNATRECLLNLTDGNPATDCDVTSFGIRWFGSPVTIGNFTGLLNYPIVNMSRGVILTKPVIDFRSGRFSFTAEFGTATSNIIKVGQNSVTITTTASSQSVFNQDTGTRLVRTSNGAFWALILNGTNGLFLHNSTNGSSWNVVINIAEGVASQADSSMEVNGSDFLYITYNRGNISMKTYDTIVGVLSVERTVNIAAATGLHVDTAINSSNYFFMLYAHSYGNITLNWTNDGGVTFGGINLSGPVLTSTSSALSLSVDMNNNLHVFYSNSSGGLMYFNSTSSAISWTSLIVDPAIVTVSSDIIVDTIGNVHVLTYAQTTPIQINYTRKNVSQSTFESSRNLVIDSTYGYPHTIMDQNGDIYMFYHNNSYIRFHNLTNGSGQWTGATNTTMHGMSPSTRNAMFFANGWAATTTVNYLYVNATNSAQMLYDNISTVFKVVPVINTATVNKTYFNTVQYVKITANITDAEGHADISVVNLTIYLPTNVIRNSTLLTSATDIYEFNYTFNLSEGNWSVEFFATDSHNVVSARRNTSWIIDTTISLLVMNRSDNKILLGRSVNITTNFIDTFPNTTAAANQVRILNPDGTLNIQYNITANTTFEFNSSATGQLGNYTLNFTVEDLAGNRNSSTIVIGFGRINVTQSSRLTMLNFTTELDAWGTGSPLTSGILSNLITNLTITLTPEGEISSRTANITVNLSLYSNWTSFRTHNSTGHTITVSQIGSNVSWTSEVVSTGLEFNQSFTVNSNSQLNYTINSVSSSIYRFLIATDIDSVKSFNEYVRVRLPASMQFEKTISHPRYFVCTSNPTRSYGCTTFSTGVDVTSANSGTNDAAGYPVNMKVYDNGSTITELSFQANHTDFLVEIHTIAGSFTAGSGAGGAPAVGGGGAPPFVPVIVELPSCPEGYAYNIVTDRCEQLVSPIAEFELDILKRPVIFGLNLFHIIIILLVLSIISGAQIKKVVKKL